MSVQVEINIDGDYKRIRALIVVLIEMTKSGRLKWQAVPGHRCYYQTFVGQSCLIVSCTQSECWIQTPDDKFNVHCDDLQELCKVIIDQIKKENSRTCAAAESLNAFIELASIAQ